MAHEIEDYKRDAEYWENAYNQLSTETKRLRCVVKELQDEKKQIMQQIKAVLLTMGEE